MNMKRLILAGCSIMVFSAGTALAGPCDTTGRTATLKNAGSGPASQGSSQTTGVARTSTSTRRPNSKNRASGDVAASSQDAQRQTQGQPTAAQQAKAQRKVAS